MDKRKCINLMFFFMIAIMLGVSSTVLAADMSEVEEIIENAPSQEDYPDASGIIMKSETICDYTQVPYKTRINKIYKVFNKRGIERFGEARISYDEEREKINLIKAYTIKPDGEVEEVSEDAVHDVTPPELTEANLYSNVKDKVINFPALEPGSIIVYSYMREENEPLIKEHFWRTKNFAYIEPIKESNLTIKVPKDKKIYYQTVRSKLEPEIIEEKNHKKYIWKKEDIAAVPRETSMPPLADIVPIVKVSTFANWQEFSEWYSGLVTDQYELNKEVLDIVEELTADCKSQEDKIRALYNFAAVDIRYVGLEYGISGYKPHKAVKTFTNRYGDCKDMATLLIAMLGEIGVEAEAVLIGTSGHSNLEIPGPMDFNHMIVYLPEEDLYLDPTSDVTMYGNLPISDQGKKIFFPMLNQIKETPVAVNKINTENIKQTVKLDSDGKAEITISWNTSGAFDSSYKYSFKQYNNEQRELILRQLINSVYPNAAINDHQITGVDGLNDEFKINVVLNVKNYGQLMGDNIAFKPVRFPLNLGQVVGSNKREHPVYIQYTLNIVREIVVELPEGQIVSYMPEDVEMDNEVGSLTADFENVQGNFRVSLDLKTKKHIIALDEYQDLRQLFNKAEEIIQQQIMLGKSGE